MLVDTISRSISSVNALRAAKDQKTSIDTYQKALKQVNNTAILLQNTLDCINLINNNHIKFDNPVFTEEIRQSLFEYANACGKAVYNNELTADMARTFQSQVQSLSKDLRKEWKTASADYTEEVLGYLSLIAGITDNPKYYRDMADSIREICENPPTSKSVSDLIHKVRSAKAVVDKFSLNPAIESFLKKVSSRQATIADLTPEVMNWLKENRLAGKLKIRF